MKTPKEIMEIKWRKGARCTGDPVKVFNELEKIRERDSSIEPEAVVNRAKAKNSALHKNFTWDDTEAARLHRLEQARGLIRSVEVVYQTAPQVQARMYSVTTQAPVAEEKPRKVYQTTKNLLEDPLARDELLSRAIREALSFRRKYHGLSELAKVFHAMDEFVEDADEMLAQ